MLLWDLQKNDADRTEIFDRCLVIRCFHVAERRRVNLLSLIRSGDPAGGGPIEGARQLGKALERLGHQINMVTLDPPDAPWLATMQGRGIGLGPASGNYGFNKRLVPWLKTHREEFDAVIVDGLWQYPGLAARRALAGTNTPYFVFTHGMLDPWFKRQYPAKHLKKMAYWWAAEAAVLSNAAAVLFTSEQERELARQSFRPYRVKEQVIGYGTSRPTHVVPRSAELFYDTFPALKGRRFILFLGRIHEKKGCDILLHAFAAVAPMDSNLRLVMAGPDQAGWRPALEQLALRLGIADRVTWPGMLQGAVKWGALMAAEAFALPSHQENFGIAVAEALAAGTPALISNKVDIWREIEEDGAGLIFEDTIEGTIEGLRRWLALTPLQTQTMRAQASRCFDSRFDMDAVAGRLIDVISEELGTSHQG